MTNQKVITGIDAEIIGLEPLAESTKRLYLTPTGGFAMSKNGVAKPINRIEAQKFLEKHAPDVQMYKLHPQLLHR
jgi:hypothetical protein